MVPTRVRTLVAIALGFGLLGYVLSRLVYADLPTLPAYSPVTLLLVALLNGYLALAVRDRSARDRVLHARPLRVEPLVVARYAALAKASSVLGAMFLGGYLGLLGYLLGDLDKPQLRSDARVSGFGAAAALLLVLAALRLERACRVPPDAGAADDLDADVTSD
jgi:hypothetical protein